MTLAAGRLRQRVDIVRPVEVDDGNGGSTVSFQRIAAAVPAEVIGLSGRESVMERALQSVSVYQITVRFRANLVGATGLQLRYGTVDLNIRSALDVDGRRESVVMIADTAGVLTAS